MFFVLLFSACQKGDDLDDTSIQQYKVHVVYGIDGLGDREYNDAIYQGIWLSKKDIDGLYADHFCPESTREVETDIAEWFACTDASSHRLLILTQKQYVDILTKHSEWQIPEGDAVLLLGREKALGSPWDKVYTRNICFYGTAYEAGKLAASVFGVKKAALVCANPYICSLWEEDDGFVDGFISTGASFNSKEDIYYLAQDETKGFSNSVQFYNKCDTLAANGYDFIFPECGGSIEGILHYTRQHTDAFLTAGIVNDMQAYSNSVAYSLVTQHDKMISQFIKEWANGLSADRNRTYGIGSGYINLELSDNIKTRFPSVSSSLTTIEAEAVNAENKHLAQ